jgi:hypothetical protein
MTFNIDHIKINLKTETNGLRVTTEYENLLLFNQTFEETKNTVENNYAIVKKHFQDKVGSVVSEKDLENVSLKIVLYYFYMYNHWRTMYEREKNRDLTFLQKDFEHPYTSYQIIDFFKNLYPGKYAEKCEIMLGMTQDEFRVYAERKEQFDNK